MATDESDLPGPTDNPACFCPLEGTLETLSAKYAMQVVCVVGAFDEARFSDVESAVPDASTSTLSARLEELVAAGLLASATGSAPRFTPSSVPSRTRTPGRR